VSDKNFPSFATLIVFSCADEQTEKISAKRPEWFRIVMKLKSFLGFSIALNIAFGVFLLHGVRTSPNSSSVTSMHALNVGSDSNPDSNPAQVERTTKPFAVQTPDWVQALRNAGRFQKR